MWIKNGIFRDWWVKCVIKSYFLYSLKRPKAAPHDLRAIVFDCLDRKMDFWSMPI